MVHGPAPILRYRVWRFSSREHHQNRHLRYFPQARVNVNFIRKQDRELNGIGVKHRGPYRKHYYSWGWSRVNDVCVCVCVCVWFTYEEKSLKPLGLGIGNPPRQCCWQWCSQSTLPCILKEGTCQQMQPWQPWVRNALSTWEPLFSVLSCRCPLVCLAKTQFSAFMGSIFSTSIWPLKPK